MPVSAQTPDEKPAKKKSPVKRSLNPDRRSAPNILQKPFDAEKVNKPRNHPDYRVTQPERAKAFAASSVSRLWSDKKTDLQRLIFVPGAYQAVEAVLSQLPADFQWDAVDAIDAVELATKSAQLSPDDESLVRRVRARLVIGIKVLGDDLEQVRAVLEMIEASFGE
ncbi:MAG: hypothetical protein JWQ23_2494 [Herminiimonas sp.]|nr:hypothetical protein [Herminiimonas sp.]